MDVVTIVTSAGVAISILAAAAAVSQARSAKSQRRSADEAAEAAGASAVAAQEQADQAQRQADAAEQQLTIMREQMQSERDERERPSFLVAGQPETVRPATVNYQGDHVDVPIEQVAGAALEVVTVTTRGPVGAMSAVGADAIEGVSFRWERPLTHEAETIRLWFGDSPPEDGVVNLTLVFACEETAPGGRTWERRCWVQARLLGSPRARWLS